MNSYHWKTFQCPVFSGSVIRKAEHLEKIAFIILTSSSSSPPPKGKQKHITPFGRLIFGRQEPCGTAYAVYETI